MANLAQIAYEASLRRLDKQETSLGELRARAGVLLAAASIALSFFGPEALKDDTTPVVALLAIASAGAFVVAVLGSLDALLPRTDLYFSLIGSRVYEELYDLGDDVPEIHRRLAYDLDRFWEGNDREITRVARRVKLATYALLAEVILLAAVALTTL